MRQTASDLADRLPIQIHEAAGVVRLVIIQKYDPQTEAWRTHRTLLGYGGAERVFTYFQQSRTGRYRLIMHPEQCAICLHFSTYVRGNWIGLCGVCQRQLWRELDQKTRRAEA